MKNRVPKHIIELARENRKNLTQSEFIAWERLRNRRYRGYKFLRQHPLIYNWNDKDVHFFIADFYCHPLSLVLEIDGTYHQYQKEQDKWRDEVISELNLRTLRIKNEECGDIYRILDEFLTDDSPLPTGRQAPNTLSAKQRVGDNETELKQNKND